MDSSIVVSGIAAQGINLPSRSFYDAEPVARGEKLPSTAPPSWATAGAGRLGRSPSSSTQVLGSDATRSDSGNDKNDSKKLTEMVRDVNDFLQETHRTILFKIDEKSGEVLIQVQDSKTHEVIRQIPSEEMLEIAKHLDQGKVLIFKKRV